MKNYIAKVSEYKIPNIFSANYTIKRPSDEDFLVKLTLLAPPFFLRGFYWFGIGFPPFLSPAYLIFPFSILIFLWSFFKEDRTSYVSFAFIFYQVFAVGLLLAQITLFDLNYGLANELGRVVFPPTYFFICYTILRRYSPSKVNDYFIFFVKAGVALMALETAIRFFLIVPMMLSRTSTFYAFKPSLFFMDSNFTGFILVTYLSMVYYYRFKFNREVFKRDVLVISFLTLATLSRASIFSAFVVYFYAYFLNAGRVIKMLIITFGVGVVAILIPIVSQDGSFKTKIKIVEFFNDWLTSPKENLLFGLGSGNMSLTYKMGSHNLIGLTIEMGFIWLAIYIGVFLCAWYKIGKSAIWLLMPMFVAGTISLYPITYTGVVFIGFVFMILLKSGKTEESIG
jgi:hypothetical protein